MYPAATPMNVKILKMAVGNLGILKKRREYPKNPIKILNAKRGPQTLRLVLIVENVFVAKSHPKRPRRAPGYRRDIESQGL